MVEESQMQRLFANEQIRFLETVSLCYPIKSPELEVTNTGRVTRMYDLVTVRTLKSPSARSGS